MPEISLDPGESRVLSARQVTAQFDPPLDGELVLYSYGVGAPGAATLVGDVGWVKVSHGESDGPPLRIVLGTVPAEIGSLELRTRSRASLRHSRTPTRLILRAGLDEYYSFGPFRIDTAGPEFRVLTLTRSAARWTAVSSPALIGAGERPSEVWDDDREVPSWPATLQPLAESLNSHLAVSFPQGPPFAKVAVALDRSASMQAAYEDGSVEVLLRLALAISLAGRAGDELSTIGFDSRVFDARVVAVSDADQLVEAATGGIALGSGSLHAPALGRAAALLGPGPGLVVVITDGPPPDLLACQDVVAASPSITWLYAVVGQTPGDVVLDGRPAVFRAGAPGARNRDFAAALGIGPRVQLLSAEHWPAVEPETVAEVVCRRLLAAGTGGSS